MTFRSTEALLALAAASLAACGESATNTQAAAANAPAEVIANEIPAELGTPGSSASPGTAQLPESGASSGMPVPGTNTPEHIVVDETGNNAS